MGSAPELGVPPPLGPGASPSDAQALLPRPLDSTLTSSPEGGLARAPEVLPAVLSEALRTSGSGVLRPGCKRGRQQPGRGGGGG